VSQLSIRKEIERLERIGRRRRKQKKQEEEEEGNTT
jgi:hypothetical protein